MTFFFELSRVSGYQRFTPECFGLRNMKCTDIQINSYINPTFILSNGCLLAAGVSHEEVCPESVRQ